MTRRSGLESPRTVSTPGVPPRRWDQFLFGNRLILSERRRRLEHLLRTAGVPPLHDTRVLDIGCGSGGTMRDWLALGVLPHNLYGVDLLADRLDEVGRDSANGIVCCADACALPFPDDSFDLISTFTLFSSVTDPQAAAKIADELRRVSAPEGCLLWYDLRYPSPRNPAVHAIARRDIAALFPDADRHLTSITLLPPIARRLRSRSAFLYRWLAQVPPLRSHYLGVIRFDATTTGGT